MFSFLSNIEHGNDSNFTRKIVNPVYSQKMTTEIGKMLVLNFSIQSSLNNKGYSVTSCSL